MSFEALLLLMLSVSISTGRNIISKKTAIGVDKKADFYFYQSILFCAGLILITLTGVWNFKITSYLTVLYGVIYGVLLILSQWMFTLSMKTGNASVCTVVYSLGFIFPTVLGSIAWGDDFTSLNGVGLALAVCTIVLSAISKDKVDPVGGANGEKSTKKDLSFVPYILVAMLASGGLGIMQQVQQKSIVSGERDAFLIIAFFIATLVSFVFFICHRQKPTIYKDQIVYTSATGLCFGGANVLNTILAGMVKSAVLFPVLNVSVILLCLVLSLIIFKERLTLTKAGVIALSIITVLAFSF